MFTTIFLKYALNTAKIVSISTTLKLLISTQHRIVNYATYLSIYLLSTIAQVSLYCRKHQRTELLERTVVVCVWHMQSWCNEILTSVRKIIDGYFIYDTIIVKKFFNEISCSVFLYNTSQPEKNSVRYH